MKTVNIYRWRDDCSSNGNFGDEITLLLLERLFSLRPVPTDLHKAELIGAGSILEHYWTFLNIQRKRTKDRVLRNLKIWLERSPTLHVWGTGTLFDDRPIIWPQKLKVHAVRGSLTASRILGNSTNIPLGDPGILANLLIDAPLPKRWEVAIVPNHIDTNYISKLDLPKNWKLIDPEQPVLDVVKQIGAADLVASSSLHGLIVSDAFGIPCVWAETYKQLFGTEGHKFKDYETSRKNAFNMPMPYHALLTLPRARLMDMASKAFRDIEKWQNDLIEVFPFGAEHDYYRSKR